jgi:putative PIN family toxin of toxin-antitoxin system
MTWVVLDSDVYISALVFGGNPRLALERAAQGLFELAVSDPIKAEVERVLAEKFRWPETRITEAVAYLCPLTHVVVPRQTVTDCHDSDDNRVLECALEAHADVIVTGDSHLLKLNPYQDKIAILKPREFLDRNPWK